MSRLTMVSMAGLRVVDPKLLELGLRLPGLVRRAGALSELPPLGLLTIASTVPEDWDVVLISDDGTSTEDEVTEQILETNPDIVAFSALTPSFDRAARISDGLRSRQVTTFLGGLHATATPETCRPHFDSVGVGDGELLLPRMIHEWETGHLRPITRVNELFDLKDSPAVRWDLWGTRSVPRYTLQTMRGCPWACSFCAASRLLGPAREKPNANIESELAVITDRQSRPWIELADDNTFAGGRDHGPMLDALSQANARWFTESDWRIAHRPNLLHQIAASGCRQILIGLESHHFRYPGMGKKSGTWQTMLDAVDAIQQAGIVVNACFLVGAEGETRQSIDRLGDFLLDASFGEIQVTLQTPFPGTKLYTDLHRAGRLLDGDFSKYTLFDVVHQPNLISPDQLQSAFTELIGRVFSADAQDRRNQIVKRIRRR